MLAIRWYGEKTGPRAQETDMGRNQRCGVMAESEKGHHPRRAEEDAWTSYVWTSQTSHGGLSLKEDAPYFESPPFPCPHRPHGTYRGCITCVFDASRLTLFSLKYDALSFEISRVYTANTPKKSEIGHAHTRFWRVSNRGMAIQCVSKLCSIGSGWVGDEKTL